MNSNSISSLSLWGTIKQATFLFIRFWKKSFPFLILIGIVSFFGNWYLPLSPKLIEDPSNFDFSFFNMFLFSILIVVCCLIFISVIFQLDACFRGETQSWYDSLKKSVKKSPSLIWGMVLFSLLSILLIIVCIFANTLIASAILAISPNISPESIEAASPFVSISIWGFSLIFILKWILYPFGICLDNKTAFQAIKYSAQLNKGWGNIFGTFFVFFICFSGGVNFFALLSVFLISYFFGNVEEYAVLYASVMTLMNFILYPWGIACLICWYKNLQKRLDLKKLEFDFNDEK